MFLYILLLCAFLSQGIGQRCEFFQEAFHCSGISQGDLLDELFKQQDVLQNAHVTDLIIEESDYSVIETFPPLEDLIPNFPLRNLYIRRCNIKKIDKEAFSGNKLEYLDLSLNEIDDFSFVSSLKGINGLNLGYNNIPEIDLNYLTNSRSTIRKLILNNNRISVFKESNNTYRKYYDFLDLSYNELPEFFEHSIDQFSSLNLSYNHLTHVDVLGKDTLTIIGNNISSFTKSQEFNINKLYVDFLPNTTLNVRNLFSAADTYIGSLNREKPLKIYNPNYYVTINLSNTSLTNISKQYFNSLYNIDTIYLNKNNLTTFNESIFFKSYVKTVDISSSGIKFINPITFQGVSGVNKLILSDNYLETNADFCTILTNLDSLDLSLNPITQLNFTALFNCKQLTNLNISNCLISSLQQDMFSGIRLASLDLSTNKIKNIPSFSFKGSYYLKSIDLSFNIIDTIQEFAFANMANIDTINLSGNKIKILESHTFTGLGVRNIYLTDNNIRYVKTRAFEFLSNMQLLNLSGIGITVLESDVFYQLYSTDTIDLSNNDIIILDQSTFRNLSVFNIDLTGNKLEVIKSGAFDNLQLRYLNLSHQRINKIESSAFTGLNNLKFIDLRYNNLSGIEENAFKNVTVDEVYLNGISDSVRFGYNKINNLTVQFTGEFKERAVSSYYLKYLNIIDSNIEIMRNNCFVGLYDLLELNIINTEILSYELKFLNGLYSLKKLNGSLLFKSTTSLDENVFQNLNNLESLILSNINLISIEENAFRGLKKLRYLYLDNNQIESINSTTFQHLDSLIFLDLAMNKIKLANFTIFSNSLPYLKTLYLSSNAIGNIVNSNKVILQELYLSENMIQSLDKTSFKLFTDLVVLHLNGNAISSIAFQSFNGTKNLQELRLDRNNIQRITAGVFDGIEDLKFLNVSSNPNIFYSDDIEVFSNLKELRTLFLDDTGRPQISYTIIKDVLPNLRRIGLNANAFTCSYLIKVLIYLDSQQIDYTPYNPIFSSNNVEGISCS